LTVADPPRHLLDGGRSAPAPARRWSICPGPCMTVVDPPRHGADGGRSAPEPAWRWSICRHFGGVSWWCSGHRLAGRIEGGRCADAADRL